MTPKPFIGSNLCRTGNVCGPCQDPGEEGRVFRSSLSPAGMTIPTENGDPFACPYAVKPQPLTVRGILHGAAGLAKAAVGADRAPDDVIRARLAICGGCPNWTGSKCRLCGCYTAMKVRLRGEECPERRWLAVPNNRAEDRPPTEENRP